MFGFVICNRAELSDEQMARYKSVYCGVCRALKVRFGEWERLGLSYDITFAALLLSALYEPEESGETFFCVGNPKERINSVSNEFISYAADMTVALMYHKCKDDWQDDRKLISGTYMKILEKSYQKVKEMYPRQCECIERNIAELTSIEKDEGGEPDDAINANGRMLSELFVYKDDFWSDRLRQFGYELGRFIYLMDAAVDYEKDIKKNSYNPLVKFGIKPTAAEDILTTYIGNACLIFEEFPIVQDVHLLRNILYNGVWISYKKDVLKEKPMKKDKKGNV